MSQQPNRSLTTVISASLNGVKLELFLGDLLDLKVDTIVNAANERLDHAGGIAATISNRAGPKLNQESKDWIRKNGQVKPGEVAVTGAGNLKYLGIIHAVGPKDQDTHDSREMFVSTIVNSMLAACEHNCTSIGFPGLSTGIFNFPKPTSAKCSIDGFFIYASQIRILRQNSSLTYVAFVLFDTDILSEFVKQVIFRQDKFEFFQHFGMPEEKALGIIYSNCKICRQTYIIHNFGISIGCCAEMCDFCYYANPSNQCFACRGQVKMPSDYPNPNTHEKCKNCNTFYFRNSPHNCGG